MKRSEPGSGRHPGDAGLSGALDVSGALAAAARVAMRAPSVHDTQPWHWRVDTERLELHTDPRRQLSAADPARRLHVLSCGAALHHARVALRATGRLPAVRRLPDATRPGLLAEVTVAKPIAVTKDAMRLVRATSSRRSEPGEFAGGAPAAVADALRQAAASEGVWLHMLNPEQSRALLAAAEHAAGIGYGDSGYHGALTSWTGVPEDPAAGAPAGVTSPRDEGYREDGSFALLYGSGDRAVHWLRAGEAMSAVWLTAVAHGLAAQPVSSVVGVPAARSVLQQLSSGTGRPYLALRIGVPARDDEAPTPRRPARGVVETERRPRAGW